MGADGSVPDFKTSRRDCRASERKGGNLSVESRTERGIQRLTKQTDPKCCKECFGPAMW